MNIFKHKINIKYFSKNKTALIKICLIISLFVMLLSYNTTRESSYIGLEIWLTSIVPALFPYLLITNLIMHFNAFTILTKIIHPILYPIFKVSKNACFCIICGFLCGFPLGIKTTNDMLTKNKISTSEANYLACFCNNISPAFYLNFIIHQNIKINNQLETISNKKQLIIFCILVPYISSLLCSIIYRIEHKYVLVDINRLCIPKEDTSSFNAEKQNILDACIINTFSSLFKIGGYITIFSIISGILNKYLSLSHFYTINLHTILEISQGANLFKNESLNNQILFLIPLCCFGGFSALMQSIQMITSTKISKWNYFKYRIINFSVSYIICLTLIKSCFK